MAKVHYTLEEARSILKSYRVEYVIQKMGINRQTLYNFTNTSGRGVTMKTYYRFIDFINDEAIKFKVREE